MEENYFFVIEDIDKNRLPSLQGTWKLYCSTEEKPSNTTNSVLIVQGQFTSDQNGGFEYNNGEPIIVDNSYQSSIIVIETIGYKKGLGIGGVGIGALISVVYTTKNYKIQLLTESQYIEERISNIKDTLENRIGGPVIPPPAS